MTLRKPSQTGGTQGPESLPYPVTPTSPSKRASNVGGDRPSTQTSQLSAIGSSKPEEHLPWSEELQGQNGSAGQLPPSLTSGVSTTGGSTASHSNGLPSSLHISQPELTPKSSIESHRSASEIAEPVRSSANDPSNDPTPQPSNSNNPFLRHLGASTAIPTQKVPERSSAQVWADETSFGSTTHAERLPGERIDTEHGLPSEPQDSNNAYSPICPTPFHEPCMNATKHAPAYNGAGGQRSPVAEETAPWSEESYLLPDHGGQHPSMHLNVLESQPNEVQEFKSPWESEKSNSTQGRDMSRDPGLDQEYAPPLPPRDGSNKALPLPPRTQYHPDPLPGSAQPRVDTSFTSRVAPTPSKSVEDENKSRKQRSETYQIRLVNWYDVSSSINPRRSPIMVQNANGPCPLLALVNALVLSTPSSLRTVLVDTLERREQITLGLLLDAVIDELMSGRRGDAAQNLPDVGDLYGFLVNLHTGMNVNPRFVPHTATTPLNLMDAPISDSISNGNLSGARFAGGFEDTREMKLYSTFAVPLIHGWIPPRNHPAFAALQRSAQSYEDAQNIMFAEEELEDKLRRQGLDEQEQLLLEDIASIKYFLSTSATQLTGYGLDSMTESLNAGQITILFRNDHFSTLYRHPRSGQLFTLVTDMGYAGHDEVVWESLVDVSGEGCEFFAGDFRPVGNNHAQSSNIPSGGDEGWSTVARSNNGRRSRRSLNGNVASPSRLNNGIPDVSALSLQDYEENPRSPNIEQEDHDLALALQLQEEEEERERQEVAARKRENELSQAFLESQPGPKGRGAKARPANRIASPPTGPPTVNHSRGGRLRGGRASQAGGMTSTSGPRGGHASRAGGVTSTSTTTTRPSTTAESEEAPPSYEQAASGPAYNPPPDHPAYPNSSNASSGNTSRPLGRPRHSSAYIQTSAALASSPPPPSPISPPCGQSPSVPASSRSRRSFRNSTPATGGLSGVEGAPGVYRQIPGTTADEPGKKGEKGDCTIM